MTLTNTLDQKNLTNGYADLDAFVSGATPTGARVGADLLARLPLSAPAPTPTASAPAPTTSARSPTTPASVPAAQGPLTATARGELVLKAGETPTVGTEVKWTITVTNTGDVPLDDVAYPIAGYHLVLKPGQSRELTSSTTLDQKRLAAGYDDLDVFTGATTPDGAKVTARIRGLLVLPSPTPSPTAPAPASALPGPSPATPALAPAVPVPAT